MLTCEDICQKFLSFVNFWNENNSDEGNVTFILKSLSRILKNVEEDDEELEERQNIFNGMGAPKIIMVYNI